MNDVRSDEFVGKQVMPALANGADAATDFSFLWLEITRQCNLKCVHCYADSSPMGTSGRMPKQRWLSLIDEARQLGVKHVQFIGGEPTIHRDFEEMVEFAAAQGMSIEVYTNLTHIDAKQWALFERHKVSVATSFYSIHPEVHDQITQGRSQGRTLKNLQQALRLGLNLRVGVIEVLPQQDIAETMEMLKDQGIADVKVDRSRGVGRAQSGASWCDVNELCGSCGRGKAAIDCDGDVFPCVFSRWLGVGNVLSHDLRNVLYGAQMAQTQKDLEAQFSLRYKASAGMAGEECVPDCPPTCSPCRPSPCGPHCTPECGPNCRPLCAPECGPMCNPQCAPRHS
jgi:MoaA/NifB/PqqE/SkfB family radical SAM enzyme